MQEAHGTWCVVKVTVSPALCSARLAFPLPYLRIPERNSDSLSHPGHQQARPHRFPSETFWQIL